MPLCTPGDGGPQAQAEAAGGRNSSYESAAGATDTPSVSCRPPGGTVGGCCVCQAAEYGCQVCTGFGEPCRTPCSTPCWAPPPGAPSQRNTRLAPCASNHLQQLPVIMSLVAVLMRLLYCSLASSLLNLPLRPPPPATPASSPCTGRQGAQSSSRGRGRCRPWFKGGGRRAVHLCGQCRLWRHAGGAAAALPVLRHSQPRDHPHRPHRQPQGVRLHRVPGDGCCGECLLAGQL